MITFSPPQNARDKFLNPQWLSLDFAEGYKMSKSKLLFARPSIVDGTSELPTVFFAAEVVTCSHTLEPKQTEQVRTEFSFRYFLLVSLKSLIMLLSRLC